MARMVEHLVNKLKAMSLIPSIEGKKKIFHTLTHCHLCCGSWEVKCQRSNHH